MHLLICIIDVIVRKFNIFKIAIPKFSMNEKQCTFKAIVTAQVKLFLPLSHIITELYLLFLRRMQNGGQHKLLCKLLRKVKVSGQAPDP